MPKAREKPRFFVADADEQEGPRDIDTDEESQTRSPPKSHPADLENSEYNNTRPSPDVQDDVQPNSDPNGTTEKHKHLPSFRRTPRNLSAEHGTKPSFFHAIEKYFPEWVSSHLKWKSIRVVIRCSISAWIGLLLLIIGPTHQTLGQAAFLVLVVAFIFPPADAMASCIQTSFVMLITVAISWAWVCIALRISYITRDFKMSQNELAMEYIQRNPGATVSDASAAVRQEIFSGKYLETGPAITCAIFLSVGSALFMWFRAWLGPSPYLFGIIFSIISLCIGLTYGPLFPYEYYLIGSLFYIPMACQIAIHMICSVLIFPQTLAHKFTDELSEVIAPIRDLFADQADVLAEDPASEKWPEFVQRSKVKMAAAARSLAILGTMKATLDREFSLKRLSTDDIRRLLDSTRMIPSRISSLVLFFQAIGNMHRKRSKDTDIDQFILRARDEDFETPAPSRPASMYEGPGTPPHPPSPQERSSRPTSMRDKAEETNQSQSHLDVSRLGVNSKKTPTPLESASSSVASLNTEARATAPDEGLKPQKKRPSSLLLQRYSSSQVPQSHRHRKQDSHHSIPSVLQDVLRPSQYRRPVAVHEVQRYMALENKVASSSDKYSINEVLDILHESSDELQRAVLKALSHVVDVLAHIKKSSLLDFFRHTETVWGHELSESKEVVKRLENALEDYNKLHRLDIIKPFAHMFDPAFQPVDDIPRSRRALFVGFHYQWGLTNFSDCVLEIVRNLTEMEEKRKHVRLWTPAQAFIRSWKSAGTDDKLDDEDPEEIPGLQSSLPEKRDPDHLPPSHFGHVVGYSVYRVLHFLTRPQTVWVYEVAFLTALVTLPAFLRSSVNFYYNQRGIWAAIMAILTFSRFVGETVFGFLNRLLGTFIGAVVGMVIWYTGSGSGNGSPYGLAAVCAVLFLPLMFYRVYYPVPVSCILTIVTSMLVVGYSWQDTHMVSAGVNFGHGWDIAWRRFLLVVIGITAAFIWSFLPPRLTHKEALRKIYGRSIEETGGLFCHMITFSNSPRKSKVPRALFKNWVALRSKLRSSAVRRNFVSFELSLRGPWPKKTYEKMLDLLLEIVDLIAQLSNLMSTLEPEWRKAFLKRCHFDEPKFLGEITASFTMLAGSMKHGGPLPKVHTPLAEHFYKNFDDPNSSDPNSRMYGLQSTMDGDTLHSPEFQRFSVAVGFASGLIVRLDRLNFAVKSLVGETYDIRSVRGEEKEEEEALLTQQNTRTSLESAV